MVNSSVWRGRFPSLPRLISQSTAVETPARAGLFLIWAPVAEIQWYMV